MWSQRGAPTLVGSVATLVAGGGWMGQQDWIAARAGLVEAGC
jgi:hypothetical protein